MKQGDRVLFNDNGELKPGKIGDMSAHGKANIDLDNGQTVWAAPQGEGQGQWRPDTAPAPTSVPEPDSERAALTAEHERITGKRPHPAIGTDKLRDKVEALRVEAG